MTRPTQSQAKAILREILFRDGIRPALIYLNGLTPHRFTALYRFGDHLLSNLYFYDRSNPEKDTTEDVPLSVTYCVMMRDSRTSLQIIDAPADARLDGHPSRHQVQSYCGVPLVDYAGKMFGSLCHFDLRPSISNADDVALMEYLGDLLHERERRLDAVPAEAVISRRLYRS